jgi:hypothetical protein
MSQKSMRIEITKDGIGCKTHGYSGDQCFEDAGKIMKMLAELGVNCECEAITPTNEQSAEVAVQQRVKSDV